MVDENVKTWVPTCVASTVPPANVDQVTESDVPLARVSQSDVNAQCFKSAQW